MIPGLKKLTALYVYEILSEAGEPKTREQINNALSEKYNIEITLKTLKALLTEMMDAGLIDGGGLIKRKSNLPYKDGSRKIKNTNMYTNYFVVNEFADDELLWLIHNTIFSKQLTENKSNNLVERLLKLGTKELRSKVGSVKGMKRFYHTPNPAVSYNIDTLSDAIHEDKTVQFIYTEYKKDKQLHPISDEPIIVKPARMVPLNGFYYLIAYETKSERIQHYRIDKIKNLEYANVKTDFSAKNDRINIDEYLSSHSFMFSGNPISVKIKIPEDKVGLVIDRFGDKIHIYQDNSEYVSIGFNSNESDLYVWALENGEYVEVIEPQRIRNKLRETVQALSYKYTETTIDYYYSALSYANEHKSFSCIGFPLDFYNEWLNLSDLIRLNLTNNKVDNIEFINNFPSLSELTISEKALTDISPMKYLSKLRYFSLEKTQVSDLSSLANIEIEKLRLLYNDEIEDYSPIYEIKGLKELIITYDIADKINMEMFKFSKPNLYVYDNPKRSFKEIYDKKQNLSINKK